MFYVLVKRINLTYILLILYLLLLIFRTHFLVAVITILTISPQTPKDNALLAEFVDSGIFVDYAEAKYILKIVTWCTISLFFITHLI